MKILIVDDNPDDRKVLRYMVEKNGHEAIEAGDGSDGLQKAKNNAPDLIISDALMPVMDGFRFLREVKQEPGLRSIPFIFHSSSYKEDQDVRLAMSLGAEAYILKPVEPAELWGKIEALLRKGKKEKAPPVSLIGEDEEYLKRYSEVVATKLEEKVRELERTLEERNRAEESLRKLSQAIEQSPVSIVITDASGAIEFVNTKFTQLTGYAYAEAVGQNPRILKSGETPAEEYERLWKTIRSGGVWRGEFHNKKKNGELFWEHATIAPIKNTDNIITHYVAVKEDITERKKLEEQLRQAQKMEAIGTLAGGVAHDFNNILTAIMGYGSIMKMKMQPDDPQRASIDQILSFSKRAAHLAKSLLAFSRKQVMSLKPEGLDDIVRSVEKLLRRLIGEDVELSIQLSAGDLMVLVDAGQIEQVLMNLATNARDAMPEGGTLAITTQEKELDEDFMKAHGYGKPGTYALVTVSDSGSGMDEATREKIFEPFFTTKELGRGTGLGLSIVYGIVKQHGGHIAVYSEPGKGTTFRIYLPLITPAAQEANALSALPPQGGTETILVAEDDPDVRNLTRTVLADFGYRVIDAVDGQDAIDKFSEHAAAIALLLVDVIMPKKSGRDVYDAAKAIRPGIKVIFTSGYTADIIRKKGIIDEGFQFLSKPADPVDLLRKIREVLDAKQ